MILVTGATGNTGRGVVRRLAAAGHPVRAMVRDPAQARQFGTGVQVVVADMTQPRSLPDAVAGVRQMLLISPLAPGMVELQARMAQAAADGGVQRIVKVSTEIADPGSDALIGQWHGLSEKAVERTGVGFCHLRPCNFMQNLQVFLRDIQTTASFSAPLGDARISLVDVDDLAAVAVSVLLDGATPSAPIVVTGAQAPTYHEFATLLSQQLGRPIHYEATSMEEARRRFLADGMPVWKGDELVRMYNYLQDPTHTRCTDAVERLTHQAPRSFADFVQAFAQQMRSNGSQDA